MVKEGLYEIIQEAQELQADSHIQDFSSQIQKYQESLQSLENKFKNAIDENRCYQYKTIVNEVLSLQTSLINSKVFQDLNKYKYQRLRFLDRDWEVELRQDDMSATYFNRFCKLGQQEKAKQIHKISHQACEQVLKDNQERFQKMQEKVRLYELQIAQLEQENSKLTEEIKEKVQEEEDRQVDNQLENNSEEEKQMNKRSNEELFNLIYQKNIGSQASDLSNSTLTFTLNNAKSKAFFDDIATAKIEISKLKCINVNCIGDCNPNLSLFLANCIPQNLDYLCLNWNFLGSTAIKMNYYIGSLVSALKKVTKEIVLGCFEISINELEEIVKAGYNSERVVIFYSNLKCSSAMDFATSNVYRITINKSKFNLNSHLL